MADNNLTSDQRFLMRHALGIGPSGEKVAYRNRFHTHPLTPNGAVWRKLVERGFAYAGATEPGGTVLYYVSEKGLDALNVKDRSGLEGYELGFQPPPASEAAP